VETAVENKLIEIENFSFSIDRKSILKDISVSIKKGEYVSIVGPNGAGKTTLIKCLNRILSGGTGTIEVEGKQLDTYKQKDLARRISYVPQANGHHFSFSVREFIMMGRYPYISPFSSVSAQDEAAVERAIKLTGTKKWADRLITTLSGGERQKVLIAAALAQEADVLLLDEPITFLDPGYQDEIYAILKSINLDQGITIISATHDINSAVLHSQKIIALKEGSLCFFGSPRDIMNNDKLYKLYGKSFLFIDHPEAGIPIILPGGHL